MVKHGWDNLIFDIINTILMFLVLIMVLYPLYFVVIASISEPYEVVSGNLRFFPKGFSLDAYRNVFENKDVWIGYRNTIFYTVTSVFLSLFLTLPAAFALSKKYLPWRKIFNWYFLFTMYFSGGLIPMYLLIKSLGLYNKPYTLIILGSFSVYNLLITRSYYHSSIPEEIYEAAEIDGCGYIGSFIKIAFPLSSPIIAVMALYYGVATWNGFFTALVYLSERDYMPLQIILRNILVYNQLALHQIEAGMDEFEYMEIARRAYMAEAMKYALIIIASFPLLIAYTFVQKYFIKGIIVGSLKA